MRPSKLVRWLGNEELCVVGRGLSVAVLVGLAGRAAVKVLERKEKAGDVGHEADLAGMGEPKMASRRKLTFQLLSSQPIVSLC